MIRLLALSALLVAPLPQADDEEWTPSHRLEVSIDEDVADVPAEDLRVEGQPDMRYFLIGAEAEAQAPEDGWKLLFVLPGGDGGPSYTNFARRVHMHAAPRDYLVVQLVAPEWERGQFEECVWPTKTEPWEGAPFTTEDFVRRAMFDVRARVPIDREHVYCLGWSEGGPAAYAATLTKNPVVTGAIVAMSGFDPLALPTLTRADGMRYWLLQSPDDNVTPIDDARRAEELLAQNGGTVELVTYEGGHGWRGDVYGHLRAGIEWLGRRDEP